jgi:hypothetical protein
MLSTAGHQSCERLHWKNYTTLAAIVAVNGCIGKTLL